MDKIISLSLGALATNCYVVPGENNAALVVDPASSAEVTAVLEANGLKPGGIIITHGHFDHFAGAASLKEQTGAPIWAPEPDAEMLQSAEKSWAWFMRGVEFTPIIPDRTFSDGEEFSVCGVKLRAVSAPGHTAGSCLLFCERYNAIFTGDVIFRNSIGRTDGFSGSDSRQLESLQMIKRLEGNYALLSGHGEITDLETEKRYNPYL